LARRRQSRDGLRAIEIATFSIVIVSIDRKIGCGCA
jgi:hypothetical protein